MILVRPLLAEQAPDRFVESIALSREVGGPLHYPQLRRLARRQRAKACEFAPGLLGVWALSVVRRRNGRRELYLGFEYPRGFLRRCFAGLPCDRLKVLAPTPVRPGENLEFLGLNGSSRDVMLQECSHQRFKIKPEGWRNRRKWDDYVRAVCDMVDRTSTVYAPWTLMEANDKYDVRVKVFKTLCERMELAL